MSSLRHQRERALRLLREAIGACERADMFVIADARETGQLIIVTKEQYTQHAENLFAAERVDEIAVHSAIGGAAGINMEACWTS